MRLLTQRRAHLHTCTRTYHTHKPHANAHKHPPLAQANIRHTHTHTRSHSRLHQPTGEFRLGLMEGKGRYVSDAGDVYEGVYMRVCVRVCNRVHLFMCSCVHVLWLCVRVCGYTTSRTSSQAHRRSTQLTVQKRTQCTRARCALCYMLCSCYVLPVFCAVCCVCSVSCASCTLCCVLNSWCVACGILYAVRCVV